MKKLFTGVLKGVGIVSLSIPMAVVSLAPAMAQTQPNTGEYQRNEYDPNSDSSLGTLNPTELIHRANLSRSRNMSEFSQDSQENLNSAAEEYKRMQQQMQQSTSEN